MLPVEVVLWCCLVMLPVMMPSDIACGVVLWCCLCCLVVLPVMLPSYVACGVALWCCPVVLSYGVA